MAANNGVLSKLKSYIPIVCSGGTFDFVGGSPGAKVGKAEAESGIFFYQQADYSSNGWRYDRRVAHPSLIDLNTTEMWVPHPARFSQGGYRELWS